MKQPPHTPSQEGWSRFLAQATAFVEQIETDDLSALAAHVAALERRIAALELCKAVVKAPDDETS